MSDQVRILRLPQVKAITGLCRSTIYQLEADGQFPGRVRLGLRSVGWVEREIQAWLAQRIQSARVSAS